MTKFYFRNTTSGLGNLPTTEQSTLTVDNDGDPATTNRTLSTTIGSAQTSINCNTNASTSAQVCHFSRFVSPVISSTSISANTWNYAFAVAENNVNANFPCSGTGKNIWVTVYVWNTNTGAKVGNIIDGNTGNADFNEPSVAAQETSVFGTFAGAAVNSIPSGCVIIYEAIFQITQNNATARTLTLYYDGTTETNANGTSVSNHASYIETPQAVTFGGGNITKSLTSTVTISSTVAKTSNKLRGPTTQTITINTPAPVRLVSKKRATTETVTIATDAGSPSFIKAKNVSKAPAAETITISSTVAFTRMRNRALTETVTIADNVDYLQHPKKFRTNITENVLVYSAAAKTSGKKRSVLN